MGVGRDVLAALLLGAIAVFLFTYCYLGALRGSAFFKFLLYTSPGNLILGLAVASYCYHIANSAIGPVLTGVFTSKSSLLENLHSLLLVVALSAVFYLVIKVSLWTPQGFHEAVSVVLATVLSLFTVSLLLETRRKILLIVGYISITTIAVVALNLANEVGEAFAELSKMVSYFEMLVRELGVA